MEEGQISDSAAAPVEDGLVTIVEDDADLEGEESPEQALALNTDGLRFWLKQVMLENIKLARELKLSKQARQVAAEVCRQGTPYLVQNLMIPPEIHRQPHNTGNAGKAKKAKQKKRKPVAAYAKAPANKSAEEPMAELLEQEQTTPSPEKAEEAARTPAVVTPAISAEGPQAAAIEANGLEGNDGPASPAQQHGEQGPGDDNDEIPAKRQKLDWAEVEQRERSVPERFSSEREANGIPGLDIAPAAPAATAVAACGGMQ